MSYTAVKKGQKGWIDTNNQNLKFLQQDVDNLISDTGWIACATLINGAQDYAKLSGDNSSETTIRRRVLNFRKFKIVMITGAVGKKFENVKPNTALVKLPSGYPVSYNYAFGQINVGSNDSYNRWYLTMDGKEISLKACHLSSSVSQKGYIVWLPINLWYVSN